MGTAHTGSNTVPPPLATQRPRPPLPRGCWHWSHRRPPTPPAQTCRRLAAYASTAESSGLAFAYCPVSQTFELEADPEGLGPLVAGDEHYSELEKKLGLKLKTRLFGTVSCLRDEGQSSRCSSQEKLNEGRMRTKINGEGLCGCFFPPENCRICFNKCMLLYAGQHVRAERSLRHHLVQTHSLR